MKPYVFVALMLVAGAAKADVVIDSGNHARSPISGGAVLAIPEIFGGYLSFWPSVNLSVDLRATLDTVDGGLTGHIPLAGDAGGRHDIVLQALGGYVHNGVESHWYHSRGARVLVAGGYGYQSAWDLRVLAGATGYDARDGFAWDPTFILQVGHFFG